MKDEQLERAIVICKSITCSIFGTNFYILVKRDSLYQTGRIFLQVIYTSQCTKTGELLEWHGRKWHLSDFMTDDEIVKTAFSAFKLTIEHEVMEGFKVNGTVLFNPHVNYKELLKISDNEIRRGD